MAKRISEKDFIDSIVSKYNRTFFTSVEVRAYAALIDVSPPVSVMGGKSVYATVHGKRDFSSAFEGEATALEPALESVVDPVVEVESTIPAPTVEPVVSTAPQNILPMVRNDVVDLNVIQVPKRDPLFVRWGNFSKLRKVFESNKFYTLFLTGLSGNGKTLNIEQAAAMCKRKLVCVNITNETDEDDLIGGFRLKDGETVFEYGPVIQAMKEGAILLLDEVDLASHKIMALQSIIDGKGYFIKKTGEQVYAAPGFTVVATANTKGRGDDTGQFAGANILNAAFLERFAKFINQGYPSKTTEKKILGRLLASEVDGEITPEDNNFIDSLVEWSEIIRKTYDEGGIDEIITTRRLALAVKGYVIFGRDVKEAIDGAVQRFDVDTVEALKTLYENVSGTFEDTGPNPVEDVVSDQEASDPNTPGSWKI